MSLLDYIEDNWRDSYRPFTRYPEIYGEHFEQGKGLLTEEDQGWSSLYKKPLGLLNVSGIPALYEAFRDEPIRDNLINAGMDSDKAGYATQAIGTALDIGVPWAVMKKGMTPWISEAVRKNQNAAFDPSRRKFLQGAGAAAGLAATGKGMDLLPAAKQVAKSAPDAFGSLIAKMSSTVDSIGPKAGEVIHGLRGGATARGLAKFSREFDDLASQLVHIRSHREDMLTDPLKKKWKPGKGGPSWARKLREYRKTHPVEESPQTRNYYTGLDEKLKVKRNAIKDQIHREGGIWVDTMSETFGHVERAKAHYKADPKGFILALENRMNVLKEGSRHHTAKLSSGELGPYDARRLEWYAKDNARIITKLEDFLKELKAGS